MKDNKHIKSFNEATENLNISDVMNSKINEGAMGIDFTKLAKDYLKSEDSDGSALYILGVEEFSKWLNDNLAL